MEAEDSNSRNTGPESTAEATDSMGHGKGFCTEVKQATGRSSVAHSSGVRRVSMEVSSNLLLEHSFAW